MIQTRNWGSLPIKMSRMKSRMMPSEERWKDWWNQILKQPMQAKQKKYYDEKFGVSSCFYFGSTVLKKDFTRKKRGKLDYRWQGPYIITAALGKGLFQLKELHWDKVDSSCASYWKNIFLPSVVQQRVNGFHLKKYICPESSTESPSPEDPMVCDGNYRVCITSRNVQETYYTVPFCVIV